MAVNRSSLYTKIHKVLKKHYKPVAPNAQLPLMQQLLYGCCLENASAEAADKALAALENDYYDWNEVRVSTATELSESMHMLPDPLNAGNRARQILQSVVESNYSFDLEQLKKENIGAAVKKLHKLKGATPFTVAYATQVTLSGHSIPVGSGALHALYIVGALSEKERNNYVVPGLERAIPKNRGVEFGSLLNQLGAELTRAPHGPAVRKMLLQIAPDAKDRLPKRKSAKQEAEKKAKAAEKKAADRKAATAAAKELQKPKSPTVKKSAQKAVAGGKKAAAKKKAAPASKKATAKKGAVKKTASKKAAGKKVTVKKKKVARKAVKKQPTKKTVKKKVPKKKVGKKPVKKRAASKSSTSRIARRKPR